MKRLLLLILVLLFGSLAAVGQTISCTTGVPSFDCNTVSIAFQIERDNTYFNKVDVIIDDAVTFAEDKHLADVERMRRLKSGESGVIGPVTVLSGEDQDNVLIFFDSDSPLQTITKVVVSTDAFYKTDSKGTKQFDRESAEILAAKINGYVSGWTLSLMNEAGKLSK